jgi:GntR family transcriptional regulator
MQMIVRTGDELPIYRQIMRQITEAIAVERIRSGDKLPSHRELAGQLVIAPLTVKKAYDELEALGYIETQRGRGTFVCMKLPKRSHADQRAEIESAARKFLSAAYMAGLDFRAAVKALEKAEEELFAETAHPAGRR